MNTEDPQDQTATFAQLLADAVNEPGKIHEGYSAFWNYSLGNQLLAFAQCHARSIALGPIATFAKWKERGRHVQKGQKALTLCQPVTLKKMIEGESGQPEEVAFTRFVFRRSWFVLAQTEGGDYQPEALPGWDRSRALQALSIEEIPFDLLNGNVWGYARGGNPRVNPSPHCASSTLSRPAFRI
jgi:hypothetical protein